MLRRLVNTVTWLLVAASVAIILGGLTGQPILVAAVPSSSMEPALQPGDLIPVLPLWGREPQPGQIVVFRTEQDQTWIVHRIVGGGPEEGFITRGDANPLPDPHPVFPRDIFGVVPAPGGQVLRIPRLGLLSLGRSSLSDPLVAGAALLAGVYLLVADVRTGLGRWRGRALGRRFRLRPLPARMVAGVYAGLCAFVFAVTLLTTLSLGSRWEGHYEVLTSRRAGDRVSHQALVGERKADSIQLTNPAPVPVIVALDTSSPDLWWEPSWFLLGPGEEGNVTLTLLSDTPGARTAIMRQAIYPAVLPLPLLRYLAGIGWHLPAVAVALVPTAAVAAVAALDSRVRMQVRRARLQLQLRLAGVREGGHHGA